MLNGPQITPPNITYQGTIPKVNFTRDDDKLSKKLFKALEGGPSGGVKLTEEEYRRSERCVFQNGWMGYGEW